MRITTTIRRGALVALAAAGLGATVPAAAHADPEDWEVRSSVPILVDVSGHQRIDWTYHDEMDESCRGSHIVTDGEGDEDIDFRTTTPVAGVLKRVWDDEHEFFLDILELDPVDPDGRFLVRTDATTRRTSEITQTSTGGSGPGCDGGAHDPEPKLPPDCGTRNHKLWLELDTTQDEESFLGVKPYEQLNKDPFKRCLMPGRFKSPNILYVQEGTLLDTDDVDRKERTIVGKRRERESITGGEVNTVVSWKVTLRQNGPITHPSGKALTVQELPSLMPEAPGAAPDPAVTTPSIVVEPASHKALPGNAAGANAKRRKAAQRRKARAAARARAAKARARAARTR